MECKKCGGTNHYKNGLVKGHQRYKCKECECQFVPTLNKGCDKQTKVYLNGLSFRTIARLLNVSAISVFYWVKNFAIEQYEKTKPAGEAVIIELDMDKKQSFLSYVVFFTFKKNKLWIWKAYCRNTGQLINWECGNRDTNTLDKMLTRLKKWNVKIYTADNWKSYAN